MLTPKIVKREETHIAGLSIDMSFVDNKTVQLWQKFGPILPHLPRKNSAELFSIETHQDLSFFQEFNPHNTFTKWAGVEIEQDVELPDSVNRLIIPSGLYAVFHYVGTAQAAAPFYQAIYSEWLPNSEYHLDLRPHLAIMGEKYKNNHPSSEEDIWIPIKRRS